MKPYNDRRAFAGAAENQRDENHQQAAEDSHRGIEYSTAQPLQRLLKNRPSLEREFESRNRTSSLIPVRRPLFAILVLVGLLTSGWAEIDPSAKKMPDKFINPTGKRFSIFAGDPERVQRVNEVNVKDFAASIELPKNTASLADLNSSAKPILDLTFLVANSNRRSYILSFPDAQRYDFALQNAQGTILYTWSDDKIFVKEVGQIFLNKGDKLAFKPHPELILTPLLSKLSPGVYKVRAGLANYPEVQAEATWTLQP